MRPPSLWWAAPLLALGSIAFHACGSDSVSRGGEPPAGGAADASARFDASRPPEPDAGMTTPPPEVEVRRSFQTPQAGGRYVYVANPTRDSVAVIDSRTLAIQTVEAGDGPTYLTTVPGRDVALVINVTSHTLTILRTTEAGTTTRSVPVVPGANAVAVSPDGRHAIAYLDTDAPSQGLGTGSFQDISLVTLADTGDTSVQLSVGFRPVEVLFSADGAAGFVVTEDGISILRFAEITGPTIIPNVSLDELGPIAPRDAGPDAAPDAAPDVAPDVTPDAGGDADGDATVDAAPDAAPDATPDAAPDVAADATPIGQVPARDISITRDGRYAIARVEGTSTLRLVDLATRAITAYTAAGAVTDLDIAPDGTYALAVVRERSEVLRIPIPMGFSTPSAVTRTEATGEFVGSVTFSPDGRRALLYTTALPLERVTLMELDGAPSLQVVRLRKAVRAVAFSPDGRTALVVHSRAPGSPDDATADLETRIDRSFGYTLLDVGTRFAKLQLTPADVGPFAITTDGAYAFVLLRNDAASVAQAHRASMRSFAIDTLSLGSPPNSVGVVSGTQRVFIGQEHPEGRITFVDWTSGALQSVTGFELNARIVD
ncbi:MAG: hypothetical protein U0324_14330 [Polyangiales bacterium]